MTLVEFMVATAIAGIVFVAVMAFSFYSARSIAAISNYVDLDNKSRTALDVMSKEIREATNVIACTGTGITLGVAATNGNYSVTFQWFTDGTVQRIQGGNRRVLLTECDVMNFGMYKRNPTNPPSGELVLVTNTVPSLTKGVQMRWICSRAIFGQRVNTESVQSALVVLRSQQNL